LYLWYKFKSIPRKLIIKYVKSKEETPKGTEILNDLPNQINIEENVTLYPRLSVEDRPNSRDGGVTYP